jgi:hypothetical protein
MAAHESGHTLLNGVSQTIYSHNFGYTADNENESIGYLASGAYLAKNPKEAFTGHWKTDRAIYEERTAQGYAEMVADEALSGLGYTAKDRKIIIDRLGYGPDLDGEKGENQIDFLVKNRLGKMALNEQVADTASEALKYPGALGYAKPLTPKALVSELQLLAKILDSSQSNERIITDIPDDQWRQKVGQSGRKREVRRHIDDLRDQRLNILNPGREELVERRRVRRSRVGKAVATLATVAALFAVSEIVASSSVSDETSTVQYGSDNSSGLTNTQH